MRIDLCVKCRWKARYASYCEHPTIGFISGDPFELATHRCKPCQVIRADGSPTCAGYTPFVGVMDVLLHWVFGKRVSGIEEDR